VWDLGKCSAGVEGGLKLTLTGHISAVRALAVSERFPYLFSCAEDKMVRLSETHRRKSSDWSGVADQWIG
jgi:pleiotropic regulator 1